MKTKKVSKQEILKMLADANKAHEVKRVIYSNLFDPKNENYELKTKVSALEANKSLFEKEEYIFLLKYIKDEISFIVSDEEQLIRKLNLNLSKNMLENTVVDKLVNDFNLKNEFELDELMIREKLAKLFLLDKNKHLVKNDVYEELKEEIEDNYYSEFGKLKNPILI